jgi:hypothetical protein
VVSTHRTRTRRGPWRAPAFIRHRSERGAALVEAAIVFIPLCIIVFGIIEYGFVFKDSLTLSSATRAGARVASAEPKQASFLDDTVSAVARAATAANFDPGDQMWIYKAQPSGDPTNACPSTTCVVYQWLPDSNGTQNTHWHQKSGSWDVSTQVACLGNANTDSVGIKLSLTHHAITGWYRGINLSEKTVMRLEPLSDCSSS